MGGIKKIRKKYSKPNHPWRIARIEEENAILKEYGIPKKTEVWKSIAKMQSYKNQAKTLAALTTAQSVIEKENLFKKLRNYNLIKEGDSSDAILGITLKDVLNRRLQTVVFKKGFSKSMKQARQMIIHRHILVKSKIISSPSYMVKVSDEHSIEVSAKSPFYATDHPERVKEASKRGAAREERMKNARPRFDHKKRKQR